MLDVSIPVDPLCHEAFPAYESDTESFEYDPRSVDALIRSRLLSPSLTEAEAEDSFFVADMGDVVRQHSQWKSLLPRVEPFYAVKCCPDPVVIKTLVDLGIGFDCASKVEIQTVLDYGVDPSRVIYANPCKGPTHIRYAAGKGVDMMTFDNADELHKVKAINPNAKMVLRILTDDSRSVCRFGVKFGASLAVVPHLLQTAKDLGVDVVGISFHVGSGCYDAQAFGDAVVLARKAFDIGASMGFKFSLLDIGGGFPGNKNKGIQFNDVAAVLRPVLDELFPEDIRIIAEPGRYFVSAAFTLVVSVVARRVVQKSDDEKPSFMYYINDGMYGSFNCITFDHVQCEPNILIKNGSYLYGAELNEVEYDCSIWGPTCDSIDCITRTAVLPKLDVGDWLYFDNMGAYTLAAASQFNGFKKSTILYTNTEQ
ncbi:pyridoxal-dependent decarboxylase [Polychytrium aggregatum]|uniref:pyridoxal-dependent decarboxylase n=1 Tax=Polychytrium aggregatum TaxID=110093 RepID=UPI0022FE6C58|nr:pyridoxal-dependent decarboxylase [Polychytrium aggregatum]KAI9204095.1 pyridoxal-dependent decarboxylase [Polychytrium aggregatum]